MHVAVWPTVQGLDSETRQLLLCVLVLITYVYRVIKSKRRGAAALIHCPDLA